MIGEDGQEHALETDAGESQGGAGAVSAGENNLGEDQEPKLFASCGQQRLFRCTSSPKTGHSIWKNSALAWRECRMTTGRRAIAHHHLPLNSLCHAGPSPSTGYRVFALRDISRGLPLFASRHSRSLLKGIVWSVRENRSKSARLQCVCADSAVLVALISEALIIDCHTIRFVRAGACARRRMDGGADACELWR
jgi:hypothetical protein